MVETRIVEAACGECQFAMPGTGCDLAVRIDGEHYFVDGTGIDDHGDAHANEGLCIGRMIVTGFLTATMWLAPPWWWTAASRWPAAEGRT